MDDTSKKVQIILLSDYYKQEGVIFSKEADVRLDLHNAKERYTPSVDDIKKAEDIFFKDYNSFTKQNINTKKVFCNYLRQYVGFIDNNGDKKIVMQLIDNSKPKKMKRLLGENWEKNYLLYFSDKIIYSYIVLTVNLTKEQITE